MYYITRNDPGNDVSEIMNMIEMVSLMAFSVILMSRPIFNASGLALVLQIIVNALGILYTCLSVSIGYGKSDHLDTIKVVYSAQSAVELIASINFTIMSIMAYTAIERSIKKNANDPTDLSGSTTSDLRITSAVILLIINISVDTCLIVFGYLHSMNIMTDTLYNIFIGLSAILHTVLYILELSATVYISLRAHKDDSSAPRKAIIVGIIIQISYGFFIGSHIFDIFTHLQKNIKVICIILRMISSMTVVKLIQI